jgi:DNA-binding transcriptional LysR family regulator
MDSTDLDLNLLTVFDALYETKSVTLASRTVGLSQPAMSYSLGKLRATFDDPLFIRIDNKMQPTPRALGMAPQIKRVLDIVQGELLSFAAFDAALSTPYRRKWGCNWRSRPTLQRMSCRSHRRSLR